MGHGFRTNGEKVGWKNDVQGRERPIFAKDWCNLPEKIMAAAEKLRGVQIENYAGRGINQTLQPFQCIDLCGPAICFIGQARETVPV